MSLHTLANHLQSAGRGEDKVLVHMTPGEVNGLQSIAMAHGGSLTTNPDTGLPEAGFLSSILPMIAGFALGPAGIGMTAMQAGLTTAALGTAATGSLKKGLMAGLGAYSGAGLGAGLQSMGTPPTPDMAGVGLQNTGATVGLQNTGAGVGLQVPGASSVTPSLTNTGYAGFKNPVIDAGFVNNAPLVTPPPADAAKFLGTDATNQAMLGKMGYTGPGSLPTATGGPQPFPADFASPVKLPRADTYFDARFDTYSPVDRSGFGIRGGAAQKDIVVSPDDYMNFPKSGQTVSQKIAAGKTNALTSPIDKGSQYYTDINGKIRALEPRSELAQNLTLGPDMPKGATGWSTGSPTGYKYYGPGGDEVGGAFPVKGDLARYTPNTATESKLFAGKLPSAPPPSNAVDLSGQSVSRPFTDRMAELGRGAKASFSSLDGLKGLYAASEAAAPYGMYAGLGSAAYSMYDEERERMEEEARARAEANRGLIRPYTFDYGIGGGENVSSQPYYGSAERTYFRPTYTAGTPYKAPGPEYAAEGGLMGLAVGGPVEQMAAMNAVGANTGYPMASINTPVYSNPMMQRPEATNVVAPSADAGVGAYSGEMRFAVGGMSHLGDYSDGGRLLKGPGDGVSDSIPASIGDRQPARLADGEFVVPARIVSEIGNGSTEAGARKLYAMMERVQKARRKTVGKNQVARNTKAEKLLPA